jgi:AcrR family transcriptional regulator
MDRKPDRRVRRTRAAIHRALISLIVERGYDAVTVTDLIERADVGRSTFYAHFTDKLDVLRTGLGEVSTFLDAHRAERSGELFAFSRPLFEHVHDNRDRLRALLGRKAAADVRATIEGMVASLVRDDLVAALPRRNKPPDNLELTVFAVSSLCMSLVAHWLDDEPARTPAQIDAVFRAMVIPGTSTTLGIPPA